MRSFITTPLGLSLIHTSVAYVPHSYRDLIHREVEPEPEPKVFEAISQWFSRLFKRDIFSRQNDPDLSNSSGSSTCYVDEYYDFVGSKVGPDFCHILIQYDNVTTTVDYTSTR